MRRRQERPAPVVIEAVHIDALVAYLRAHAVGRDHAVSAPVLARDVGLAYRDSEASGNGAGYHLRRVVRAAIDQGEPICSGDRGYFYPATKEEAYAAAQELRARATALVVRAQRLEARATRAFSPTPTLW